MVKIEGIYICNHSFDFSVIMTFVGKKEIQI